METNVPVAQTATDNRVCQIDPITAAIEGWRQAYKTAVEKNAAWRSLQTTRRISQFAATPEGDAAWSATVAESNARIALLQTILGEQPAFALHS